MKAFFRPGLIAAGFLALSFSSQAQPPSAMPSGTPQQLASNQSPESGAIRVLLSPELETTLISQMVGRISSLNASLGSAVTKGKPIVSFDCSEGAAKLQMAQAEYNSAKETLETKTRLRALEAAGDMEVSLAVAAADRGKAAIALSRAQLSQCTVLAPFDGHVVKLHVKPFQGVNIGSPLLEIVSDRALKLRLNVPSNFLRTLRIGTRFEVDIEETGKTYPAKVTAINARVDAVAQTVELEAQIDNRGSELLAGMSGVARFSTDR